MSRFRWSSHCTARRTKVSLPLNSDIRESMIIALSCAADLPASRETLTSFSSSSRLCTSANIFMLIIGSAPVNLFYFIFLPKTKESASLAGLFLHTGRWPACIESVFYWICGSRIFSLETLVKTLLVYLSVAYLRVGLVGPRPHQVRRCPTICGHILGHYTVNHQVPCHIIDNRQPSSGYSKSFFACTLIFG